MNDIQWFGHASFKFIDSSSGQRIYYVDPYNLKLKNLESADIIFITHAHHDHLSSQDLTPLLKDTTTIVATPDSLQTLNITQKKLSVEPHKSYEVNGFAFDTVPAYNNKPDRLSFHPKENNWVGYIFNLNGKKVYHAGDTDYIPEMNSLRELNLDIAMLPMGGTYTMGVEEAIQAANAIGAKVTIPMHYKGMLKDKSKEAEEALKKGVLGSEVVLLEELK